MPRSDRKPTVRERADAACCAVFPGLDPRDGIRIKGAKLWLAGHRANRLTKAERALFDQCADLLFAIKRNTDTQDNRWPASPEVKRLRKRLADVVSNLERARKGGK